MNVADRLLQMLAQQFDVSTLRPDTNLMDLGADSADWVEIHIAVLEEFAVDIPADAGRTFVVAGDIINYVLQSLPQR